MVGGGTRAAPSWVLPRGWQRASLTHTQKKCSILAARFGLRQRTQFCCQSALASPPQSSFVFSLPPTASPSHFSFVCSVIAGFTWRQEASSWEHRRAVSQGGRGGTAGTALPPARQRVNHPLNMQYHPGQEPGSSTGTRIPASLETLFPHFGQAKRQ